MSEVFDACVIGSGAGAGPVAWHLAASGKRVVVLEKGPWYDREQFRRDEIVQCRRPYFTPRVEDEPQVQQTSHASQAGSGRAESTAMFWNGSLVGGSSMLMSGFFLRLKPDDFRMRSVYGAPPGSHVADWPIGYEDLEPWYARVEDEVGVSGRVVNAPQHLSDRRSTPAPPLPPTREHPFARLLDERAPRVGMHSLPLPRAVLPRDYKDRRACDYNGYCGSYACQTGAKGGSLAAWINRAVATGLCEVRARAMVRNLETDGGGRTVTTARYFDRQGRLQTVRARSFVVACQAIESARLLLNSRSDRHPRGLANGNGLVGQNLLFSTFGAGWGDFEFAAHGGRTGWLGSTEPFVNRVVQDYYWFDPRDPRRNAGNGAPAAGMSPGGTINFILMHPNPISRAILQSFSDHSRGVAAAEKAPLWGAPLKQRLGRYFRDVQMLKVEAFGNWLPHDLSHVALDPAVRDRWGTPVARITAFSHQESFRTAHFLVDEGLRVLTAMGAKDARRTPAMGGPSTNLVGGTCRFGADPKTSVLDPSCRAWELDNLYVTDGSFMPSAGRVPFTFTIYANALRVAHHLAQRLA